MQQSVFTYSHRSDLTQRPAHYTVWLVISLYINDTAQPVCVTFYSVYNSLPQCLI